MKRLFITTTNHIDNGKAVAYHGVVSSHLVAGTGFLSDLAAGFTDIFGGRSNAYRKHMEELYDEALDEISEKAQLLGANAVLGLSIDMDNISGKGMSMFMITATGTAASVELNSGKREVNDGPVSVTSALLVHEMTKRTVLEALSAEKPSVSKDSWDFILKNPESEFVVPLTKCLFYKIANQLTYDPYELDSFKKNYEQFIQAADRSLAIEPIYEAINHEATLNDACGLIKRHQLFDAKSILKLISSGKISLAVEVLSVEQPYYNEADLRDMETLVDAFDNLPDLGKIEVVKGGVFSKDGEKYICRHGHKNEPDRKFCSNCNENIKGLTKDDIMSIETFKKRVSILKELLQK